MFYCAPCQIQNHWPAAVRTFKATCANCQEKKECFNIDVMSVIHSNPQIQKENSLDNRKY